MEKKEVNKKEINILKHVLVPEHVIIDGDERKQLLQKLNINPYQLPKIAANDPVVKSLKAKEGDIMKITRASLTAGETVYYRIVHKL